MAVFEVLAEHPQNVKEIRNQIIKRKGLEETYYASLTKRLHHLEETCYIGKAKSTEGFKAQCYEMRVKAYLAAFLDTNSMEDIIAQATELQLAQILLTLLNVVLPEEN